MLIKYWDDIQRDRVHSLNLKFKFWIFWRLLDLANPNPQYIPAIVFLFRVPDNTIQEEAVLFATWATVMVSTFLYTTFI